MRALFAAIVLAGCAPSDPPVHKEPALEPFPDSGAGNSVPKLTDAQRAALDGYLATQFTSHGWPSLAVGVILDDTLVYAKGLGGVDEHTVFRIGSVTKVMTGVALLQLREQGRLKLEDSVTK